VHPGTKAGLSVSPAKAEGGIPPLYPAALLDMASAKLVEPEKQRSDGMLVRKSPCGCKLVQAGRADARGLLPEVRVYLFGCDWCWCFLFFFWYKTKQIEWCSLKVQTWQT
jgi:hypothetical protein